MTESIASHSGSLLLGGETKINRLGFGTMQLPGPGVWGNPADPDQAVQVLRTAVEMGVNFIDTADSYGPFVAEQLIKQALYPYPPDLVIATKVGLARPGPNEWAPVGRPEYLRQQVQLSLRHLGVDCIDLLQLHRIDSTVPMADQVGALAAMQHEGLIRHIGLSEVTVEEMLEVQQLVKVVSVQNMFNLMDRSASPLLEYVETQSIAFIPWFPLATGGLIDDDGVLNPIAEELGATASQVAIAWLLKRSSALVPIPGTSRVAHVVENVEAANITLTDAQFHTISNLDFD
jgi:pyridoxine 4-dehydrogenase